MTEPTTEPEAAAEAAETPAPDLPPPTNVVAALARVAAELPGIGKDQESEQGYTYRGIEAITRHAQHLLGKYGVVFVPRVDRREVLPLTINNRPWTQDEAWVIYRVYGPGGKDDFIEVGPLIGLGRDNSDKGMNKAMTQAFKYALLQVLCVGDAKDDPDAGPAHEADAKPAEQAPIDPARQARIDLSQRIRDLTPEQREQVREFCDGAEIPRVTAQMDDAQLEAVSERVDAILITADQDAKAEEPQGQASPEGAAAAPEAEGADDEERRTLHAAFVEAAAAMDKPQIQEALRQLDATLSTTGSTDVLRARLVDAQVRAMESLAAKEEEGQADESGALPLE